MFDRVLQRHAASEERGLPDTGRGALILALVILAIMGMAITVDFSSMPAMALMAIVVIVGLIAALAAWG